MFGHNKSVVDSSMKYHSKIHKMRVVLSFHRVMETIATGIISHSFILGSLNPDDIMKHYWSRDKVKCTLKPLMFWQGNTAELFEEE